MTEFYLSSSQYDLLISNSSKIIPFLVFLLPGYPLNLFKMNNTSLLRIAATAGTQFSRDKYIYCHYQ